MGTKRQVPVRLPGRVAAPLPLRLALPEPAAQRGRPGPDRPHRDHGRRGAPDRLGPGLQQLARVHGRAPDPGAAVPRAGRVREPPGDGGPGDRRGGRLPGCRLPRAAAPGSDLAERRAGGRRPHPGRDRRDRRLHQAQPLRRHGALLRHHGPAGRRCRTRAPLEARLLTRVGPPARPPAAHPPLLRDAGPAGRRHRGRHGHDGRRPPRRRQPGPGGGPAPAGRRCATWPSCTRAWPFCWWG